MNDRLQLAELTRKILVHLQDNYDSAKTIPSAKGFEIKRSPVLPKKMVEAPPPPPAPKKKEPIERPPLDPPKEKAVQPSKNPQIREQIERLLPRMRLLEKLPQQGPVALIYVDESELSFYQSLARAILNHLAPVKLFSLKKLPPLDHFRLIVAPKEAGQSGITLLAASVYENDPEAKKELWNELCQKLKS